MPIIDYNNAAAGVKANTNSRCSPPVPKTMPLGRVCKWEDCDTVLSIYNHSEECGPCSLARAGRQQRRRSK